MLKRISIFGVLLLTAFLWIAPIEADPADVRLAQQIQLGLPGSFQLIDADQNGKAEAIEFTISLQAYQEGRFIVSGNLEAVRDGAWIAVATTVIDYEWRPNAAPITLTFSPGEIIKHQLNGAYRVNLSLKQGDWVLPQQVTGFSPEYSWENFENKETIPAKLANQPIGSTAEAKRAAEWWASFNSLKLGEFLGVNYDYDTWAVNYRDPGNNERILRFLVAPDGTVKLLKINSRS